MAVATHLVRDVLDSVAFRLTNSTTIDATLEDEILKAIGWTIYDLVSKSDLPAFRTEAQFTLADGTSDYDLPADFERIINDTVYFDSSPREWIPYYEEQQRVKEQWTEWYSSEGKPRYFTIRDRDSTTGLYQARFIPTPDTTYTVNYTYFAVPTRINEDTDPDAVQIDVRFPRNLISGLIAGVCCNFPQFLSVDQQQRFEDKYIETMEDIRRKSDPVAGIARQNERFRVSDGRGGRVTWPTSLYNGNPIR